MSDTDENTPSPEDLLLDLKTELGSECDGVDDDHLLKFLHWKPNVERAATRYRDLVKWKTANPGLFDDTLRVSKDPELERCLLSEVVVSPPSLKTRQGGAVLIGRLRNNDMTDGRTADGVCRMLFYTIDRVLQRPETKLHGMTIIHDLRGFDKIKNARLEVAKRLFHGLFGQFPVHVNAIYICNAPMVFIGFFKIMSNLFMTKKVRQRIKFIDDFKELNEIYDVIDPNDLLTDLGGTLEWSIKDWVEEQKQKEQSGDTTWKSLTDIDPLPKD